MARILVDGNSHMVMVVDVDGQLYPCNAYPHRTRADALTIAWLIQDLCNEVGTETEIVYN